jgi:hypothetical protein
VAAVSASDVWAVGDYNNAASTSSGSEQTLTEHWDGTSWHAVPSPNPGSFSNILIGVAAVPARDAWAVGVYVNGASIGIGAGVSGALVLAYV